MNLIHCWWRGSSRGGVWVGEGGWKKKWKKCRIREIIVILSFRFTGALEIDDVQILDVGSYRCNASGYGQYRLSNKAQLGLLTSDIG